MTKLLITLLSLIYLRGVSQVSILQTIKVFKPNRDSCSIITQINNNGEKIFRSEIKCRKIESDSLSLIELRKTKLIQANIPWRNKK